VLARALRWSSYVTIFGADTPYDLIKATAPTLVKGGDWTAHRIVGADLVPRPRAGS
jgi:bifunctional ADP-heptose synthase (sugar kinase/adenylyltransferase)